MLCSLILSFLLSRFLFLLSFLSFCLVFFSFWTLKSKGTLLLLADLSARLSTSGFFLPEQFDNDVQMHACVYGQRADRQKKCKHYYYLHITGLHLFALSFTQENMIIIMIIMIIIIAAIISFNTYTHVCMRENC